MKKGLLTIMVALWVTMGMVNPCSSETTLSYTTTLDKEKLIGTVLEILSSYGWPEIKYDIKRGYIRTGSRKCKMNHALVQGHFKKFSLRYDITVEERNDITDMKVKGIVTDGSFFGTASEKRTKETERRMILWLFKVMRKYNPIVGRQIMKNH